MTKPQIISFILMFLGSLCFATQALLPTTNQRLERVEKALEKMIDDKSFNNLAVFKQHSQKDAHAITTHNKLGWSGFVLIWIGYAVNFWPY